MFDINSIGQQLNWDYILPSQVGQATLHGIANALPNSDANLVKKFNQEQFSPINYLPHTANNSLQAQYGMEQFKEGGEFSGDMDKDMEDFMMGQEESNTPLPAHEQSTQQESTTPASSYVDEVQNEYANEQIANSIIYSNHQRVRYDENGIMSAPRTHGVNLQGIQPDVIQAGQELLSKFPGLQITSGVRNWGDKDAHPLGRAMDVSGDPKTLKAASEYYSNEIVPKYKFNKPLSLNHGTGPHIHLGYYDEGGDVKDFYNQYLNSPNYKKRLQVQGYGNPQQVINDRLNQLNKTDVVPVNGGGSSFENNKIYYDKNDPAVYHSTQNEILAHEFSHAAGSMGYSLTTPSELNNLTLNRAEINNIDSRNNLKRVDPWSFKDIKKTSTLLHDSMASESKADIDALRYRLFKDKIYDTGTQNFNQDTLNKAKSSYKKDGEINRVFNRFSDKDLIYLMNNLASNNPQQQLNIASNGGLIKFKK